MPELDIDLLRQQISPVNKAIKKKVDRRTPPGEFFCTYEGCNRSFVRQAALTTHYGWHRRQEKKDSGEYDANDRFREEVSVRDESGQLVQVAVYRCEHPGCQKFFTRREALQTHWGWHRRRDGTQVASATKEGKDAARKRSTSRAPPPSLTASGSLRPDEKLHPPGQWCETDRLTQLYEWLVDGKRATPSATSAKVRGARGESDLSSDRSPRYRTDSEEDMEEEEEECWQRSGERRLSFLEHAARVRRRRREDLAGT